MSYNALRKGRYSHQGMEYLVTCVVAGRRPVFRDFRAARILIAELRRSVANGESRCHAWVVMPDHLHVLLSLPGATGLHSVVGAIKGRSARLINARLCSRGPLWQPGFHDHALRDEEDRAALAHYIIENPVRAGLVANRLDYPHWDCEWLQGAALSG